MASTLVTPTRLIKNALETLGVYAVGESLSAAEAEIGLSRLNSFVGSLSIQNLAVPTIVRGVFDLTANDGTYTIGTGADFNTIRPTYIQQAAILLTASDPDVEVPLAILTQQAYNAIQVKSQTSTQPTSLFYDPTFSASGWGTIILWPIPTTAVNDLVLYYPRPLTEFSDLTTPVQIPPGYEEMLSYNLAVRLAAPFGRKLEDDVRRLATQTLANIKRQNTPMVDLGNDMASIDSDGRYGWNIQTDSYT